MDFDYTTVTQISEVIQPEHANEYIDLGWTLLKIAERKNEDEAAIFYILGWCNRAKPVYPEWELR